jgi:hypothetical protein
MLCPTSPSLPWVAWVSLPHFPRSYATLRLPPAPLGVLHWSLVPRYLACVSPCVVSPQGSWSGRSAQSPPGPLVTRSPSPGIASRSQGALPRSRVPPVKACPALRPRWCPAHAPSRAQDCCLPAHAHRRLPTTLHISGLNNTAYLLAPPGSVRPFTGRHAGWLLTCWLDLSQGGIEPHSAHPLGNINQFHGFSPSSKVSGLPWREHALVRPSS